jgi:hypothetical protein
MSTGIRCLMVIVLLVVGLDFVAIAQPGTDPNEGAAPGEAPISGIEILIGLGGLLGAKKMFEARKKN